MRRNDLSHQVCFLADGGAMALGSRIAFGGEGGVYPVDGEEGTVVKIYHEPPDQERVKKLVAMITHRDEDLDSFTAWPIQTIHDSAGGSCIGFSMTSAVGFKEAHKLYSPRDRKAEFDFADWRFLVRAASNIAKALGSVHAAGHVIGDVNHSSVMIGPEATCRLIDCDSYQISVDGKTFPCRVGEPLHTAPELFGVPLHSTLRKPNHDLFGLAVLVFELLFMGKHPFAGAFLGQGEPSLEDKMREFRFAYSPNAANLLVAPPPDSLSLQDLSPQMAQLFIRAFSKEGAEPNTRPTAREWASGLDALFEELVTCSLDSAHSYYSGVKECPWCQIERATGAVLFNFGPAFRPNRSASFDAAAAWKAIEAIKPPSAAVVSPTSNGTMPASENVRNNIAKRRLEWASAASMCAVATGATSLIAKSNANAWGVIILALATALFWFWRRRLAMLREAEFHLMTAEGQLHVLTTKWDAEAEPARFTKAYDELRAKHHELQSLAYTRAQKLSDLERHLEPRLRRKHLEQHRIAQHTISGVNLTRCVALAAHGVESAADISETALTGIPGVGPSLRSTLIAWRKDVEMGFRFDSAAGIPVEEIEEVDRELAERRRVLESELASGASVLALVKSEVQTAQATLMGPMQDAIAAVEQARADRRAVAGF